MAPNDEQEKFVLFENDEGIGFITLNRPEKMNALCWGLMDQLEKTLKAAERDPEVRVMVIRGAGRCFSTGYDLEESDPGALKPGAGPSDGTHDPRGVPAYGRGIWNSRAHVQGHIHFDQVIWGLWKPVIAQVHGHALAGGSTLALACDLTMMANDARIGYPPNRWLATGDNIGLYSFLTNLKRARELSYGRILNGEEAAQCGLITHSFAPEELAERTLKIAREIASIEPELLMLNKMVVNRVWEMRGIRTAMEISGEFDSICHLANTGRPIADALSKSGGNLREALKQVNKPWGGV